MGQVDQDWFRDTLRRLMAGIAGAFGSHCEVVLHDFSRPDHSIVWMEGNVTGRRVGGALTDLGLAKLRLGETEQDLIGYITQTKDGKVLRSSSVFLRDEAGKVTGALCINLDITPLLAVRQHVLDLSTPVTRDVVETFVDRPSDILRQLVHESLQEVGSPRETMGKQERLRVIASLDRRGAFALRSAVPTVSKVLGVSRYTLYNYLKEVREAGPGADAPERTELEARSPRGGPSVKRKPRAFRGKGGA